MTKFSFSSRLIATLMFLSLLCLAGLPSFASASATAPPLSIMTLTPQNPDPDVPSQHLGTDNMQSAILINGASLGTEILNNVVVRIEMNTGLVNLHAHQEAIAGYTNTGGRYLDVLNVPAGENIASWQVVQEVVDGQLKATLQVTLKSIDPATSFKLPYNFSLRNRLTPNDFVLKPVVTLWDEAGKLRQTLSDNGYQIKYVERKLSKSVATEGNYPFYAGLTNPENTAIDEIMTAPVPFFFIMPIMQQENFRQLHYFTVTDTLPTYTDINGNLRTAVFKPEENPGWSYVAGSNNTQVQATWDYENNDPPPPKLPFGGIRGDAATYFRDNLPLKLHFPGMPVGPDGTVAISDALTNTAEGIGIPYNPGDGEQLVSDASIKFRLTADLNQSGPGLLTKGVRGSFYNDPLSFYLARPRFTTAVVNSTGLFLGDIVLTEDVSNIDPRIFMTLMAITSNAGGGSFHKIELIKDGVVRETLTTPNSAVLNAAAEADLKSLGDIYRQDPTAPVRPVNPDLIYDTVKFYLGPDFRLAPGFSFGSWLDVAFRDPYNMDLKNPSLRFNNTITLEANLYESATSQDIVMPATAKASASFAPLGFNETMTMGKSTTINSTGVPGESVLYSMHVQTGALSLARAGTPVFVDLLPLGVSANDSLVNHGVSMGANSLRYLDSVEKVENFKGTGRTALIIKFKRDIIGNLQGGDYNVPHALSFGINALINNEIIPTQAQDFTDPLLNNNNEGYFYFEGEQDLFLPFGQGEQGDGKIESHMAVPDEHDIIGNGSQYILKATSPTKGSGVEEVRGLKFIRSTEPDDPMAAGLPGERVFDRPWQRTGIHTRFSDDSAAWGSFQYRLQIRNFTDRPVTKLSVYDPLPYVNDGFGSNFANTLTTAPRVWRNGVNVSDEYRILYYLGQQGKPPHSLKDGDTLTWTEGPVDLSQVRAIKVELISPKQIPEFRVIEVIMDMKAPRYVKGSAIRKDHKAINGFEVSYDGQVQWGITNQVTNQLLVIVPVEKKWKDGAALPKWPITVQLYQNGQPFGNHIYPDGQLQLTEQGGWEDAFYDLPLTTTDAQGRPVPAVYTVKEAGYIPDNYRVGIVSDGADGFVITNTYVPPPDPGVRHQGVGGRARGQQGPRRPGTLALY